MNFYVAPWVHVGTTEVTSGICCVSDEDVPSRTRITKDTEKHIDNFSIDRFNIMEVIQVTEKEFKRLTDQK